LCGASIVKNKRLHKEMGEKMKKRVGHPGLPSSTFVWIDRNLFNPYEDGSKIKVLKFKVFYLVIQHCRDH
jgi:hypothetical protein